MSFSPKTFLAICMTALQIKYLGKSLEMRELALGLKLHRFNFMTHQGGFFPFSPGFFQSFLLSGLQFSRTTLWLPWIHLLSEITLQSIKGAVGLNTDMGCGTQGDNLGSDCGLGYSSSCFPFTCMSWGRGGVQSVFSHPFWGCSWPRLP